MCYYHDLHTYIKSHQPRGIIKKIRQLFQQFLLQSAVPKNSENDVQSIITYFSIKDKVMRFSLLGSVVNNIYIAVLGL